MVIVELRDDQADCSVVANRTIDGDLVLSGCGSSSWLAARTGRRDYAYFYKVKAKRVPQVCAVLGVGEDELLPAVRALLAPHGIYAIATWRAWLQANDVAWVFWVW
jgi:hypothetical protein